MPRSEPIIGPPPAAVGHPAAHRGVGEVAQRDGHGVGGVDRPQGLGDAEEGLHHALHLVLGGAADAGDGLLHLVRGVLDDLAARPPPPRPWPCPAAWATDMARAHVDLEQHPLDGHHRGLVLGEQGPEVDLELGQALGRGQRRLGAQHADGHRPGAAGPAAATRP